MEKILFGWFRQPEMHKRIVEMRPRLYRVAYAWCHDSHLADDIVQETIAKALRNARQLKEISSFEAWMFSILHNCWRDVFRKNHPAVSMEEVADMQSDDASPEEICIANDTVSRVRSAIVKLPIGQRQVIVLVDLEEFTYEETAQALGIPIGTVMSRLCRGRQNLRTLLQQPQLRVVSDSMQSSNADAGGKNE